MSSSFEELLEQAGSCGRFQRRVSVLFCLLSLSFAGVYVGAVFQAFTPEHRCQDPAAAERAERCGWSPEESRRLTPPAANGTGEPRSGCLRYDRDWTRVDCQDLEPEPSGTPITACQGGWEYDYQGRTSVVTEFDLVCGDAWLVDWFQSTLNIGFLISSFVFGYIADRFGRRICILAAHAGAVAASVALVAVSSYPPILLLRTLLGFSAKGSWLTGYVTITEMVGVSHRRAAGMLYQVFFSLGLLVLSLLAFLIPDWRWLHAASSAPYAFFLLYYWLTPESPRWLVSQNKMADAVMLLHAMAQENRRKLGNTFQIRRDDEAEFSSGSLLDLIRTRNMRRNTLILMFNWFTSSVVYQGLVMRVGITQGNVYLDFFISGLVEFPAAFLILLTIDRIGRRLPFAAANMVAGVSCLITAFIPDGMSWLRMAVSCVGRLGITMAFEMVMFVNTELYPTFVRTLGVSVCSTMSDVGGIAAPFLLYRLAAVWLELPLLVFGVVALLAGALVLRLPETKGLPLPETIDDIEFPDRRRLDHLEDQGARDPEDQGTRDLEDQGTRDPGDQRTRDQGTRDPETRDPEDQRTRDQGTRDLEDQGTRDPEDQRTRDQGTRDLEDQGTRVPRKRSPTDEETAA